MDQRWKGNVCHYELRPYTQNVDLDLHSAIMELQRVGNSSWMHLVAISYRGVFVMGDVKVNRFY